VADTAQAIRAMLASGRLPPPVCDARCPECSLREICEPTLVGQRDRHRDGLATLFDLTPLD
jgi:CRISPR-associated exonuclease Cas4